MSASHGIHDLERMNTAPTIGAFDPPLTVGDRFRSTLGRICDGYCVVESVEKNGVVAVGYSQSGNRGGHISLFLWDWKGVNSGGYTRIT